MLVEPDASKHHDPDICAARYRRFGVSSDTLIRQEEDAGMHAVRAAWRRTTGG
jgi:hypothetical protein